MGLLNWLFGGPSTSPVEIKATMPSPDSPEAANLRRWQESGEPLRWVKERGGQWNHDDWETLLEQLRGSSYWPLDTDAVGHVLEELKQKV